MKARKVAILAALHRHGIKTVGDLDTWRNQQRWTRPPNREYIPSRHGALVYLVGEDAAIELLNELALRQCCPEPGNH